VSSFISVILKSRNVRRSKVVLLKVALFSSEFELESFSTE
jgi:hypothetical protein